MGVVGGGVTAIITPFSQPIRPVHAEPGGLNCCPRDGPSVQA